MKLPSLAMLALAVVGCSIQAPSSADWEQQIRAAEERHRVAFLTNDVGALDAMFSDDFLVNSPQNRVVNKGALMGLVRGGALAISSFDQKIESVRRYGDIVTVMGEDRVVYAAPSPNAGQDHRRRFTDIWQLRGADWRFVARQASITTP
ncbi:MAG: nuclear transport factor 2 family protein [Burkholderiaceae bacterium]